MLLQGLGKDDLQLQACTCRGGSSHAFLSKEAGVFVHAEAGTAQAQEFADS